MQHSGNHRSCQTCEAVYSFNGARPHDDHNADDHGGQRRPARQVVVDLWQYYFANINTSLLDLVYAVLFAYLLFYLVASGPLEVTIHSADVPDMDILLWPASDTYAVACLDQECLCETYVWNNDNNPRWQYVCRQWAQQSIFIFSNLRFRVFDADLGHHDDFIGGAKINLLRVVFSGWSGQEVKLAWHTPYKGNIQLTIDWQCNFFFFLSRILSYFH